MVSLINEDQETNEISKIVNILWMNYYQPQAFAAIHIKQ